MAFFKEKKPREIKDDDPLFIKLWYGKRSHAAIVLGLYFIFFLILILIINFSGKKTTTDNMINGSKLESLFTSFNVDSTSYNHVIKDNNKTYYFSGSNIDGILYGSILYDGDSTSVKISDGTCIVGDFDEGEFVPANELCPENISYNYFNIERIYNLIENIKGQKYISDKYYLFEVNKNVSVKIYYDDNDKLSKVILSDNKITYELTFVDNVEVE